MRRLIALALAAALMIGFAAPAAYAGGGTATNVALGLASFAVFNQLAGAFLHHQRPAHAYYERPVYVERQVYVSAPPPQVVVVQPTPPPAPTVVQYPHGRYELRSSGYQYYWVWIPNPPPPPPQPAVPPPPPAPPAGW